jgi:two-component system, sensor histidine kinase and response regulator
MFRAPSAMNTAASHIPVPLDPAVTASIRTQRQTVAELFTTYEQKVFARTNRLFCWLLLSQWAFAITLAVVWSPRAWAGTQSTVHPHLIAAVAFGGILVLLPLGLIRWLPHHAATRHVVAVAQVSFSALLIHLTGGRLETHFHVFGSLAFLSLYRDWRVIATATIVVTGDHLLRGIWYSESVYGVPFATIWRTLEHAGWVVFEDVVLVWACFVSRREMWEICTRQDALAAERARLKFIFESVPVGIAFVLPGENETFLANPSHQRITGLSASDVQLTGALDKVTHPDDLARQQPLTAKLQHGEIDHFSLEQRYIHRSGKIVWANMTRRVFTDPVTGAKQAITTWVDITDLKAAQEEAARQQARLKFIFDAVPVGFTWMVRDHLHSRIVNPAHARMTGVPLQHSQDLARYSQVTHPEDRIREQFLQHQLLAGEIDHYDLEKRYIRPDGTICWTAETLRSFRDRTNGQIQEVTTLIDITERKAAEAKLAETHKLVDASRRAGTADS